MVKCEATLMEWQGVALCEVCDWNENGSDGPHGTDWSSLDPSVEYEMYGCPDCGTYCGEWGCDDPKPAVRDGWEAIRDYCGPCLEGDGPCNGGGCGEWCTVQRWDRATRCRHGINSGQCVTCSGKRDEFASYRKADGEGRFVKPYAELSPTARGSFGIGQVRAVITSGETETRQWTDAPSEGDWASASDPDAPAYVNPKAKRGDVVPQWYSVMVRGATPTWPNPDAYDRAKYFAAIADYCNDTPEEAGPIEALIP